MTDRPDGFDAALVAYLPSLRRQARYLARDRGEELLQDAVTDMLSLADRCRVVTFRTWAQIMLRRAASNFTRAARREKRTGIHVPEAAAFGIGTQPGQQAAVELSETIAELSTIQDGEAVLREAMGDTLTEIGRERGISREAMRQRRARARNELIERRAA